MSGKKTGSANKKKPSQAPKSGANIKKKKKANEPKQAKQVKSAAKPVKSAPKKTQKKGKPVKAAKPEVKEIKSETLRAYERQKKLEDTMPLGSTISQLTSDLPILGTVLMHLTDVRGRN